MDPTKRNAASMRKRIDELVKHFISHYSSLISNAQEAPTDDYSRTAQKELAMKEDTMGIITTAQYMATFIRDLQELWLFGSLDTLTDPADEEAGKAKAMELARLVERLAGLENLGLVGGEGEGGQA